MASKELPSYVLIDEDGEPLFELNWLEPHFHGIAVDGEFKPITRIAFGESYVRIEFSKEN